MGKAIKIGTISQCNELLHEKTQHPLISIIELGGDTYMPALQMEFYAILLRDNASCHDTNGWQKCDYCDATLIALSPEKLITIESSGMLQANKGHLLIFHPLLLQGLSTEGVMKECLFFDFKFNEALHLSAREYHILLAAFCDIRAELHWGIDEYSRIILVNKLELLLNYCRRFYRRQFITRQETNRNIISQTDNIIENYILQPNTCHNAIPSIEPRAPTLTLSNASLATRPRHHTSHSSTEFIQKKRIEIARRQLLHTNKSIHDIACGLGFGSAQHFCHLFKKLTGYAPLAYRLQN